MILLSTCRLSRTGTYPDKQKILHKSTLNCPGNYVAIGPHCGRPMIVNSRSALVALASISLWTIISGVSPSSPKRQKVVNGREIEGHEWRGSGRLSGRSRWLGTLVPSFLEYQAPNIISDNPLRRVLGPWKNIGKKGLLAAAFLHTHSHQSQLSFSVGFFYSLGHSIILRGWMICLCLGPLSLFRTPVFVEELCVCWGIHSRKEETKISEQEVPEYRLSWITRSQYHGKTWRMKRLYTSIGAVWGGARANEPDSMSRDYYIEYCTNKRLLLKQTYLTPRREENDIYQPPD